MKHHKANTLRLYMHQNFHGDTLRREMFGMLNSELNAEECDATGAI